MSEEYEGQCVGDCGQVTTGWFGDGTAGPGWYCGAGSCSSNPDWHEKPGWSDTENLRAHVKNWGDVAMEERAYRRMLTGGIELHKARAIHFDSTPSYVRWYDERLWALLDDFGSS